MFVRCAALKLNYHHSRCCVVDSDSSVKEADEVLKQRDVCFRDWPSVLELARECRSAGVAMLLHSGKGKSRSGSVASLCLSDLDFPGCRSIMASHLVVGKARVCVLACNPAYLRWAQELLDEKQHCCAVVNLQTKYEQHLHEHAALSWLLLDGKAGVPKNFIKAFEVALQGNRLNCAHSKGALARCYVAGRGVTKDTDRGLQLARESAAAGSCYGHFVLGAAHVNGEGGVLRDYVQAVAHWRLAATQGLAAAQFNLGTMYSNGQGLPQDQAEAIRLYQLAAAQDYSLAQYALGYMLENGLGVAVDLPKAVHWYQSASLQRDGEFCRDAIAALRRNGVVCE
jgi:hypothetical protein